MKLNTCLLACAMRASLRRAFRCMCLYLVSYIRLRSRFNIKHVHLCFTAQGRCGKLRSRVLKHPGGTGPGSEESQVCLAPAELLGVFHGRSPVCFIENAHYCTLVILAKYGLLQPCGGSPARRKNSWHLLVSQWLLLFKSSWLLHVNPPSCSCLWPGEQVFLTSRLKT